MEIDRCHIVPRGLEHEPKTVRYKAENIQYFAFSEAPCGSPCRFAATSRVRPATWNFRPIGSAIMRAMIGAALILALVLGFVAPAVAEPFEDGLGAYAKGDYATTLEYWRPLAEQGLADAQCSLGWMYAKGEGVPEDDAEAAKWYRRAAEQGLARAQYNLGVAYDDGVGVPESRSEAAQWYRKAAEQGLARAQYNLGVMSTTGAGVPKDDAEAVKWFRMAAEQGYAPAQSKLGFSTTPALAFQRTTPRR